MTEVLEYYRSAPRFVGARVLGKRAPGLLTTALSSARLVDRKDPKLPSAGWGTVKTHLSGVCGSDLAMLSGKSSFYFGPLVSMPFTLGHEVVGELVEDLDDLRAGTRVVVDPVLGCLARGLDPCATCSCGLTGRCDRVRMGHLQPGLQTGYCADTGGGWGGRMVAHRSQLYEVPDDIPDERAVLTEPFACAIHSVFRAGLSEGDRVAVVGAGTVGLLTVLALRAYGPKLEHLTVIAKHPRQQELAKLFGADEVLGSGDQAVQGLRRSTHSMRVEPEFGSPYLLGGVDATFECVGARAALDLSLRVTRAGGTLVVSGIPANGGDLTPLWFRELTMVGAYTTGLEDLPNGSRAHSFELALATAAHQPLEEVIGGIYPLARWREALDHALSAGSLGAPKVIFEPSGEQRSRPRDRVNKDPRQTR